MTISQKLKFMGIGMAAAFAAGGQIATAETYQAAMWLPPAHPITQETYPGFAESVRAATEGEIDFELYIGGSLLPPKEVLQGVGNNVAQLGFVTGGYTPARLPLTNVIGDLAFTAQDSLAAAFAATEMYMTDESIQKEWLANNVVFGGGFATPIYNIICAEVLQTAEDLKGKKIRTVGGSQVRWAEFMGAVPVSVPSSETYTGLQLGTIDCTLGDSTFLTGSNKLTEVSKSVIRLPLGSYISGASWGYNQDFWAGLSAEQRRLLFDNMAEALTKMQLGYEIKAQEAYQIALDENVQVLEPDQSLTTALAEYNASLVADLPQVSMETRNVEDPTEAINRFLELQEKWVALLSDVDTNNADAVIALVKSEIYDKIDENSYGLN